jgi:protein-S-isoprenylcysteine O-methyltransferase Ste14
MSAAPKPADAAASHPFPSASELPSLGRRGEGWAALQVALLGTAIAAGLRGPAWPAETRGRRRLGAGLAFLAGAPLLVRGGRELGPQLTPFPKPTGEGGLKQDGVYRLVRHPMYGGGLLMMAGWALVSSPLALAPLALAAPFLDLKRRREEAWLIQQHPDYEEYCARVPHRFIPFVW